MNNLGGLQKLKKIVFNVATEDDSRKIIEELVERNNLYLDWIKNMQQQKYEVETVPVVDLKRGKQSFITRFLEQQAPNNELIYSRPTMITHIYRAQDDYDLIDTTLIPYVPSLIQIFVNNASISNIAFDSSMLPNNPEHAFKLPTPIFVQDGDRITMSGGTGLTDLRIGLQGFEMNKGVENSDRVLHPYFLCAKILPADRSKTLIIPPWMNLDITGCHSFIRVKPSDSDNAAYADYNTIINSVADGDYNGSYEADVRYDHGGSGFTFMTMGNLEETVNWCGTREFPRPVHDLFPDLTTNMEVICEALALNAGAELWRWMILAGKYSEVRQEPIKE